MQSGRILSLVGAAAVALGAGTAEAHIKLMAPMSRQVENAYGDPQKNGPCGKGGATDVRVAARVVKAKAGSKLMVRFSETVTHSGWFRISFDEDGQDGFKNPTGPNDIQMNPTLPVLADGLFKDRTLMQNKIYEHEITLPDMTCTNCTLQVMQVMTDKQGNGWGNDEFYYHCVDLELTSDGGGTGGMGTGGMGTGGMGTGGTGGMAGAGGGASGGAAGSSTGGSAGGGSGGDGGSSRAGNGGSAGAAGGKGGGAGKGGAGGSSDGDGGDDGENHDHDDGGGCAVASGGSAGPLFAVLLVLGLAVRRRRRG